MIETLRPGAHASRAKIALFDFDGTISTIRAGWVDVMVPMMVECLAELKTGESEAALTEIVREFVGRLTGKDTIYQMIELSDQVKARGGTPLEPLAYKRRYLDLLWVMIQDRVEGLRKGQLEPDKFMVPGARALLELLKDRGLKEKSARDVGILLAVEPAPQRQRFPREGQSLRILPLAPQGGAQVVEIGGDLLPGSTGAVDLQAGPE